MCALFGFLDYGKRMPWKIIQKLVQALANASEVRGHHATGVAYNTNSMLTIYKRPKPAHKLHFRIPDGTAAVMGHEMRGISHFTSPASAKRPRLWKKYSTFRSQHLSAF